MLKNPAYKGEAAFKKTMAVNREKITKHVLKSSRQNLKLSYFKQNLNKNRGNYN